MGLARSIVGGWILWGLLCLCVTSSTWALEPCKGTPSSVLEPACERVAAGDLEGAIAALERERALDAEAIEPRAVLRVLYGWTGRGADLPGLLVEMVALTPEDLELREGLVFAYTGNGRAPEALPHLEWLVARLPGRHDLRYLLARLLADARRTDEAITHLEHLVNLGEADLQARFLLAQLTHWSVRWPTARAQYEAILSEDPTHADAQRYLEMLRQTHAARARAEGLARADSNGVLVLDGRAHADAPLTGRVRVGIDAGHAYVSEENVNFVERIETQHDRVDAKVEVKPHENLTLEGALGWERFFLGRSAPRGAVALRWSALGRVFGRVAWARQGATLSVVPIYEKMHHDTLEASIYAEPIPELAISLAGRHAWWSDGNRRRIGFGAIWWTPFDEPWLLRPSITWGHESWARLNPDARPYFTQPSSHVITPGVDMGRVSKRYQAQVGYGLAVLLGGGVSHLPRASFTWRPSPRHELTAAGLTQGSALYRSYQGTLRYSHRF